MQKAAAAIQRGRFLPGDALIMSPERWAWVLGSVDANVLARSLLPDSNGPSFQRARQGLSSPVAQGMAGHFGAYPVYTDPTISLTANSTTNQDEIYFVRSRDLYLWESPIQSASFDATYAGQCVRLVPGPRFGMAFIGNRYAASVQSIRGTGF